jgi:pyruvate/2-oxoglutarate dehydrogenase complex dihydrolipoamide acyltransferase (E2) component
MAVEILMPELGESVHEGTVSRWLKQVGDFVKEDEPVVEIMTDKVNTELGAPASGILVKITIPEGELVEVFAEMGVIEEDEAAAKAMLNGSAPAAEATTAPTEAQVEAPAQPEPVAPAASSDGERRFYTPVVRAIAKQNNISDAELETISGSGQGGRVTKTDIENFIANRGATPAPITATVTPTPSAVTTPSPSAQPKAEPKPELKAPTPVTAGPDQEVTKLVGMRKAIADHMERSSQIPVVSTLIEIDVTPLVEYRAINKDVFVASHGVKLTYTPFFIKALAECLGQFPMLNSSLQDGNVITNKNAHIGIAVSLGKDGQGGLIVPPIRDCNSKTLVQIARDLDEIAGKARSNTLSINEVQGATFTLTNPGSYGAILGTPMISAPQAGILGVYGIVQKPVIINGMIAVRSIMNAVLTYDHRLVDGLQAGRFLQSFKGKLESMDFFK